MKKTLKILAGIFAILLVIVVLAEVYDRYTAEHYWGGLLPDRYNGILTLELRNQIREHTWQIESSEDFDVRFDQLPQEYQGFLLDLRASSEELVADLDNFATLLKSPSWNTLTAPENFHEVQKIPEIIYEYQSRITILSAASRHLYQDFGSRVSAMGLDPEFTQQYVSKWNARMQPKFGAIDVLCRTLLDEVALYEHLFLLAIENNFRVDAATQQIIFPSIAIEKEVRDTREALFGETRTLELKRQLEGFEEATKFSTMTI